MMQSSAARYTDVLAAAGCSARPRWMDVAACRTYPAWWWFAASTRRRAIRICGRCPVRVDCLAFAVDHGEVSGVWGGTTPADRRDIRHERERRTG
jgi:WhiB family redox-sensing transcriptional regulator